jgi:hypothetical protein
MEIENIDLGRKGYGAIPAPATIDSDEPHYPTLYIDYEGGELTSLPDSGEMTVKFRVNSRTESERDGKKSCSLSLDIKRILSVKASETPRKSREDELDEMADAELKRGAYAE